MIPSPPKRLLVIANPAAGQGPLRRWRLRACLAALAARGCVVTVQHTEHPGHAEELARAALTGPYDAVVAAGGDGTINEVANGLIGGSLPLGLIPLGTANVLAVELGLRVRAASAAAAIAAGRRRRVHLGRVDGRRFLLMAGAGIDAEVVAGVDLALKRRTGKFAYLFQTLVSALRYGYPPLRVVIDGVAHRAFGVVVCKGRHYGGPFIAAPRANLEEPGLEVCLLGRAGLNGTLRAGVALMLGRLGRLPEVSILPAREVTIEGADGAPLQGDGDILAHLPCTITVAEETLELLAPL